MINLSRLHSVIVTLLVSVACSEASADSLDCSDGQDPLTEISFYNRDGKIVFQASAPRGSDYLYLIGNCYSESEIGLPYHCDSIYGEHAESAALNLIESASGTPAAELTLRQADGSVTTALIPCVHND